jgi:intein/homing endonuclease
MPCGFDCGTFNLVSCHRDTKNDFVYKREVNAFLELPLENRFVFNMMKSAGVPLIERDKVAYALGEAACNMTYTMSALELKRPMIHGCVNPKEKDAFQIMSIMIHSLIDGVNKDGELLYYCVPANAINEDTDADYHQRILEAIFKAYKKETGYKVDAHPINEALALVYAELGSKAFTGIGISCLCPGTKIYTNEGIVEIQNVKEGDHVITHTGKWSEVSKVIKKNFTGTMTKIQICGYSNNTEEYKFVDNHELLVKRDGKWTWIGCEEIVVGDIVGEPILKQNRDSARPAINICERTTCSKEYKKTRVESAPDLQRFIGYFLGDGSINKSEGCIQIDFGKNESEYAEDVIEILNTKFKKNATETIKSNGSVIRVKCYSRGLVNWMSNHCYNENGEKQYPWSLDRLTNSECLNLLCGLVRSDGTISEDQVVFGNTNTKLILLVKQLFSRIGIASSISWREPREHFYEKENRVIKGKKREWSVSCGGKKVSKSLVEQFAEINCQNSRTKESIFIEDGFCCGRVQAVEHEDYEGDVYDLQVPGDHSFSGPFLTIHNCGAGMVNICYAMYGSPVFSFSIVNSGDWIDKQAAKATGESISFINKEKTKVDLLKPPTTLVERAIHTQYRLMIEHTVAGIKKGFSNITKTVRADDPIDIVIAGGTSSPNGFAQIFKDTISQTDLPIKIGQIIKPNDPLYSVARGCLIAAEAAAKS